MTQAQTIIKQLGGKHEVAQFTGANHNAVRAWYRIGIPHRYWHLFQREAVSRGVEGVTAETLEATRAVQPVAA